jgi:hypothetical protein
MAKIIFLPSKTITYITKEYYKYKGQKLLILPEKKIELPSKEYLAWHNENVFLA